MPQDAFTIRQTVSELSSLLVGAKINRVSQPDKDEVYLLTYSAVGTKTLILSANAENARIGFTSYEKPNPKVAPNFCMLLRKHLLSATVESIEIIGFERIVKIVFVGRNDFKESVKKEIYLELMGKYSNIILTENGVILGCLKNAPLDVATTRITLSGAKYVFPKPQDKVDITDKSEAIERLKAFSGEDLGKFIFENIKGVAYPTAEECAYRAKGYTDTESLYNGILSFMTAPPISPNVCGEGKRRDFYVCDYQSIEGEKVFFDTVSDAQSEFFDNKEKNKDFSLRQKGLLDKVNGLIKKLGKKLQAEDEKLLSCKDYETLRIKGELITANIYRIGDNLSEITLENYYDEMQPIVITLDKGLSASKNAQRYFKKYSKEKRTIEILTPQREETFKELEYLNTVWFEINQTTNVSDFKDIEDELIAFGLLPQPKFRQKEINESEYRIYDVLGYTVKCGKNNVQNDRLTSRAYKDDMWLHTKGFHSAHVIIETKGDKIPDKVIEISAQICAYYSDAKQGNKVAVDYTYKKFVKKPPKAHLGTVTYTDYKTCLIDPDAHEELRKNQR